LQDKHAAVVVEPVDLVGNLEELSTSPQAKPGVRGTGFLAASAGEI
jgi:hypothetical protein